ncbi:MAG: response regulator transcription factor [Chloroflexota bacterium]|nr:MAG: response regulator transcription factor [Chloroflexota bacterium]
MQAVARILVVDDDESIRSLLSHLLQREGHEVISAVDGADGVAKAQSHGPALIILDVMMPNVAGFEAVHRIRMQSSVPILMLTSRSAESDKVEGFERGADDYLTKPFGPRELIVRVKALLRRGSVGEVLPSTSARLGPIEIDFKRREVTVDGTDAKLTPTEFRLLASLAARPGETVSARALVKSTYGYDMTDKEAMDLVRVNINRLRQKIEPEPAKPTYIQTVRGFGYTLALELEQT